MAAYLLALLAIVEGLVRLSGVASRHVPDRVYRYFDADIPYVHAPNLRGARGWGNTRFNTDARGLRSAAGGEPDEPKAVGEYRVALVGDSVTFGEGVATSDVFGFGPLTDPLHTQGLPVLDLTHLKDAFTTEGFEVGPYDPHPSAVVHQRIADALVPWIAELRGRARLPQ